jgi:hypothetical protein
MSITNFIKTIHKPPIESVTAVSNGGCDVAWSVASGRRFNGNRHKRRLKRWVAAQPPMAGEGDLPTVISQSS